MKKKWLSSLLVLALLFPACQPMGENSSSDVSQSGNDCAVAHVDQNDDGACDQCSENVRVILDFYSINDLHGKFEDTSAQIGVDELSTYLKNAKSQNPYTFFLSAGDMWQGSPESNLTKGALMTEWMNEMEFVSMTLGNHEFDWGTDYIASNAELANFPFLGINVYDKNTGTRPSYCQPSVTVEKNGVKVGIIGAIGDCLSSISGEYNRDLDFKTGGQLTALVQAEAERLRADGADVIVYSVHEDFSGYDTILSLGYVDLVFEGHSHQTYAKKDGYGVYHLQGGGDNENGISNAMIELNIANGKQKTIRAKTIEASAYKNLSDDTVVDTLMDKYQTEIAPAYETLGNNSTLRKSWEILQTCAKLYYERGVETWGGQYDIFLGGGYMSARAPYELLAGNLCYADLMNVLPFDNQLTLCSIKGRDLKSKFLETENSRYYIYTEKSASSVQDNATYYIVTDTYSSTYRYNNLTEIARYTAKTAHGEYTYARDLLAEYIREGKWS